MTDTKTYPQVAPAGLSDKYQYLLMQAKQRVREKWRGQVIHFSYPLIVPGGMLLIYERHMVYHGKAYKEDRVAFVPEEDNGLPFDYILYVTTQ